MPLRDKLHGGRVEAGASVGGIPWANFSSAPTMPDPNEQEVAFVHAEALGALGGNEVVDGYMIAGLQP